MVVALTIRVSYSLYPAFVAAVNWNERWIQGLLVFHLLIWVGAPRLTVTHSTLKILIFFLSQC